LPSITTIFSDIGGVILSNGWDHHSRRAAAEKFRLEWDDFEGRHELSFPAFDSGLVSMNEYLDRTIFYKRRTFTREEFVAFMFEQSKEYPESRAVLDCVARSGKYLVGSINNEPFELNEYRIEKFDLRRDFLVFFSSCYVHSRKPEQHIYRLALQITQRPPAECIFIDDRPLNLENPRRMGMNVILYQNAAQLRSELQKYGVDV
jgi:putative hydrolase of the HAD superfamily